jgi:hypothetical protein
MLLRARSIGQVEKVLRQKLYGAEILTHPPVRDGLPIPIRFEADAVNFWQPCKSKPALFGFNVSNANIP